TQINFKTYNLSKTAKYGLLFRNLNSVRFPYTFYTNVYAGKPKSDTPEYYITGNDNFVKNLVEGYERFHTLRGRNITTDRFYTSIPLADWLLNKNITILGTIRSDRKRLPKDVIGKPIHREDKST